MNRKKEKNIPVVGQIENRINRYYLKISRKYMAAGIALMFALVCYIIMIPLFFGSYVTYDNLKYLLRDIGNISLPGSSESSSGVSIVYNGGDDIKADSFRGGIAVLNSDSYFYYDGSGILLTENELNYASPDMVSSEKYMLVYDVGGVGYSVYNQLTCIISREADERIVTGNIADDGSMLLVTRSRETKYVVELYNAAFTKSMRLYKENYVIDAAISPDGKYILIASGVPSGTDLDCEISIIEKGADSPLFTTVYSHTMPLELVSGEDGFILLCDNGINYFDYSGSLMRTIPFSGINLRYADITAERSVIVGSVNALGSENKITVLDSSGEVLYDKVIEKRITGAYTGSKKVLLYYKTTNGVCAVYESGEEITYDNKSYGEILTVVPEKNGAFLCTKSSAVFAEN